MTPSSGNVLVVDDQEFLRDLLARYLKDLKHTVMLAGNGRQALDLLRAHKFDLVLLDIMMPVMSGFEVLAELKGDPQLSDIPVIVISADTEIESIITCIKHGAEDYLFKPYNSVLLNARVNACLDKKRLREQERAYLQTLEQRVAERTVLAEQRATALERSEAAFRRQTTVLQSILDSMGDGVVVVDTAGALVHQNPAARHTLADRLVEFLPSVGHPLENFHHADQVTIYRSDELPLAQAIHGRSIDSAEIFIAPTAHEPSQWLSVTARPLREPDGTLSGGVAVFRDISADKQAEVALRESEERYALAAQGANDGLWDWDLKRDQLFFSPRWKSMLGYAEEEIGNTPDEWFKRVHPDDRERLEVHLAAHFRRLIAQFEHEYRVLHRDGNYRWMLCRGLAIWDASGQAMRMAGSQTDITDRKSAEQRLQHDALHDVLTGLPNRALLVDRLGRALARLKRSPDYRFALLFLDLDRFKMINDSLGHAVGDQLLITIAQRVESCLRPGDTIARMGGDEFTILLEEITDEAVISDIADRIQREISSPLQLDSHHVFTTASIGITLSSQGYDRPADMIRDADTAMYHAKMRGKARHVLFHPSMHTQAMAQLELESDLRQALVRQELSVYYQPIISLDSGQVTGFEALVRWQHPRRGLLYPADFIDLAEETGLIIPIGWWVLREACRQVREWQMQFPDTPSLSINVNLSSKQIGQPDVVEQVVQALNETGLSPRSLKLEITEHTLIDCDASTTNILTRIRELGVQLCIDDFGTGYSSLSYLYQLPIDALKIDRSFISRLESNGENGEIVQTIISLARMLGLEAVAEGIETEHQIEQLKQFHCTQGQGWLFSRAVDAQSASDLVKNSMFGAAKIPELQA